jgi:hypothetical protein
MFHFVKPYFQTRVCQYDLSLAAQTCQRLGWQQLILLALES